MGKKSDDKKLFQVMYLRIDGNTHKRLISKAQLEDSTVSEMTRNAITEYLDKDTNWQGQIEGNFSRLFKDVQALKRMKQSIFSDKHTAWEAVEEALRFNPDRIIFGEVRNSMVMVALATAWNTGHKGSVTTIHANSCLSTLSRIKKLLISGGDRSTADELSEIIHLVIHLTKTDAGIRVDEIMEVSSNTDNLLSVMEANGLD